MLGVVYTLSKTNGNLTCRFKNRKPILISEKEKRCVVLTIHHVEDAHPSPSDEAITTTSNVNAIDTNPYEAVVVHVRTQRDHTTEVTLNSNYTLITFHPLSFKKSIIINNQYFCHYPTI